MVEGKGEERDAEEMKESRGDTAREVHGRWEQRGRKGRVGTQYEVLGRGKG